MGLDGHEWRRDANASLSLNCVFSVARDASSGAKYVELGPQRSSLGLVEHELRIELGFSLYARVLHSAVHDASYRPPCIKVYHALYARPVEDRISMPRCCQCHCSCRHPSFILQVNRPPQIFRYDISNPRSAKPPIDVEMGVCRMAQANVS